MKTIKVKGGIVYITQHPRNPEIKQYMPADEGGWIQGIYESQEAAQLAIFNPARAEEYWSTFSDNRKRSGEAIKLVDLQKFIKE